MKGFLLTLTFSILALGQVHALKVYLLSNHNNAGDRNHTLGIANHLSAQAIEIDTSSTSPESIKEDVLKALKNEKVIVLGAGEGGVQGIQQLSTMPNLTIALSSHMYLPSYSDDVINKVNFIALPKHTPDNDKKKLGAKLIEVTGVPHNRERKVAEQTYNEWKKELPACSRYVGVMLGGDAPTPTNQIRLFTKKDAEQLAKYLAEHTKDECILVLNGPRTGKHDDNHNVISTAHKNGKLDKVTQHFVHLLKEQLDSKRVKVFDFQFNNKTPYNSFDLAIGAINETDGYLLIPGDSTSMVSEAIDNIKPGHVLIYTNNAMNEIHTAHVQTELEASRASVLENYQAVKTNSPSTSQASESAAESIAKKLKELANI